MTEFYKLSQSAFSYCLELSRENVLAVLAGQGTNMHSFKRDLI